MIQALIKSCWAIQVSVAAFRDLDSLPSAREDAALQEWLDSKYAVHAMRDHPKHTMPILAGMWGIKMDQRSIQ